MDSVIGNFQGFQANPLNSRLTFLRKFSEEGIAAEMPTRTVAKSHPPEKTQQRLSIAPANNSKKKMTKSFLVSASFSQFEKFSSNYSHVADFPNIFMTCPSTVMASPVQYPLERWWLAKVEKTFSNVEMFKIWESFPKVEILRFQD